MTGERRSEVVTAAVVLSVVVHVCLMFFAEPRVMTRVSDYPHSSKRPVMHVGKADLPQDLMQMTEVEDVVARKQAPEAGVADDDVIAPFADSVVNSAVRQERPFFEAPPPDSYEAAPEHPASFKVDDLKSSERGETVIPVATFETRFTASAGGGAGSAAPQTPAAETLPSPVAPKLEVVKIDPPADPPIEEKAVIKRREEPKVNFTPSEKVYEKVDAKIVEQEKAAVRELMSVDDAVELRKFVNTAMTTHTTNGWTYFKVMVMPRRALEVVPKDVVILIDASGSIGRERIRSIRSAVKELLRSASNSGDRFNLVAFRDRYTYAFKSWQRCTESSFARADGWLGELAVHGRTDVFSTISSVLSLPRDPARPLIALVITDGEANYGVSGNAQILSKFTALNDGLVSVYMYGVKASANRELINVLTRGNRGESFVQSDFWQSAGSGIGKFSERFRDPVLSDLRIVYSATTRADAYPRMLKNLYRGEVLELVGRVPAGTAEIVFSLKGLSGREAYEGFFRLAVANTPDDFGLVRRWNEEHLIDKKLR